MMKKKCLCFSEFHTSKQTIDNETMRQISKKKTNENHHDQNDFNGMGLINR